MLKVMKQYSVFLPNKPGELKKLLLKTKKINFAAAATFASKDGAIMRLIPQDKGSFQNILKKNGISFSKEDVIVLTISDKPGGLLNILSRLQKAHINIDGVYIVGGNGSGIANCVIQVGDVKAAKEALKSSVV